jgi:hypothetical protein
MENSKNSIAIGEKNFNRNELLNRLALACSWLTDIAQVKDGNDPAPRKHLQREWRGAMKGEYSAARKEWWFFCPVWHTGQAVKALSMAWEILRDGKIMEGARAAADFIVKNQITDKNDPDHGLVLAFEDHHDKVNTSAILEALDGLMTIDRVTGESRFTDNVISAVRWVARKTVIGETGLLNDLYDPAKRILIEHAYSSDGRPLLDDAVFLRAARLASDNGLKKIFYNTAGRLLADESPAGNWINYVPCNAQRGNIHPRHAYWWGYPMLDAYNDSDDKKYLDCFLRSCRWYAKAQRADGGLLRGTYTDFNTDSFGHATSGMACALQMWLDADAVTGKTEFADNAAKGLEFCLKMQFTNPSDPNLKGAILEKVLPPDGTDASPYHIRDLGTIFFIQALAKILN